jgi:hypothetical protein
MSSNCGLCDARPLPCERDDGLCDGCELEWVEYAPASDGTEDTVWEDHWLPLGVVERRDK